MSQNFMNHFKGRIERTDKVGIPGIMKQTKDPGKSHQKRPNKPMCTNTFDNGGYVGVGQQPLPPAYQQPYNLAQYGHAPMPYMPYPVYQPYNPAQYGHFMGNQMPMFYPPNAPVPQWPSVNTPEPSTLTATSGDKKRNQRFIQAADNILPKERSVHTESKAPKQQYKENIKARAMSNANMKRSHNAEEVKQLQHVNFNYGGLGPNYTEEWKLK